MNLVLHLPPETEERLRQSAAETGKTPEALALEALDEKLACEEGVHETPSPGEWLRQFDAWVGELKSRNPNVDDSRDSIYEGRGE